MYDNIDDYNQEELVFHNYGNKTISYYTDNIIWGVIEALHNASNSVKVNMAYLTNEAIIETLMVLPEKGITVEIIISNTDNSRKKYGIYNELLSKNVKIFEFGDDDWKKGIMHRKSATIDSKIVLSGSYNWTDQADRNTEELFIIEDLETVKCVENEFDKLKAKCNALVFQQPPLGQFSECTKDKQTEIQKWWTNLDNIWQTEFIERFKLKAQPDINDLIRLINSESFIINFSKIEDLTPLIQFNNLKKLIIYSCKKINDLTPLKTLKSLEYLDIASTSVENLEAISELNKLEELNISNTNVTNIDPLNNLKLKRLDLYNVNLYGDDPLYFGPRAKFFKLNPDCIINGQ